MTVYEVLVVVIAVMVGAIATAGAIFLGLLNWIGAFHVVHCRTCHHLTGSSVNDPPVSCPHCRRLALTHPVLRGALIPITGGQRVYLDPLRPGYPDGHRRRRPVQRRNAYARTRRRRCNQPARHLRDRAPPPRAVRSPAPCRHRCAIPGTTCPLRGELAAQGAGAHAVRWRGRRWPRASRRGLGEPGPLRLRSGSLTDLPTTFTFAGARHPGHRVGGRQLGRQLSRARRRCWCWAAPVRTAIGCTAAANRWPGAPRTGCGPSTPDRQEPRHPGSGGRAVMSQAA